MKKNTQAFTLIELIVVIVILSILATIWFLWYSSYTLQARDSARKSDITILSNAMKNLSLKWTRLVLLVDTGSINRTGNGNFYFWWINLTGNPNYKAGAINYDFLTDVSSPLFDPKTKTSYIVWAYQSNYDLATTIEENNMTYIQSSYKKRTASWTIVSLTGTVDVANKNVVLLNQEETVKLRIWDYIWTWTTVGKEIIDIIWEKIYLSDVTWISSIDKIRLLYNDTSLIGNVKIWLGTGIDCNNLSNLKENICPIREEISWLVPYNVK